MSEPNDELSFAELSFGPSLRVSHEAFAGLLAKTFRLAWPT
jgi:hypothetical protein